MAWQAPNPSNSTNGPYRRTLQSIQDWSRGVHSVHGAGTAVSVPATGGGAVNALWGPRRIPRVSLHRLAGCSVCRPQGCG